MSQFRVISSADAFLVPNSEQILGARLSTEFNAEAFPGAAVVKSFNQTAARQLAEKRPPEFGKRVVFVSSNDSAASTAVARLCTELGFAPIDINSSSVTPKPSSERATRICGDFARLVDCVGGS